MLDEKHVLVNISQLAESTEGLKDEDTIRYMEEHLCPFDHTFMLPKPPRQKSSIILDSNGKQQIDASILSFNTFVEEVDRIELPGRLVQPYRVDKTCCTTPKLYKNIYKCNICGSYYVGNWYYIIRDINSTMSVVYPSDEDLKEFISRYEESTGNKFCEEKVIEELFKTKLIPYGNAFLNYKNKGQV